MPEVLLLDQVRSVAKSTDFQEVVPAQLEVKSGIKHKFSALFRGKGKCVAIDVFDKAVESHILRGRIKESDVDVKYCIKTADPPPVRR